MNRLAALHPWREVVSALAVSALGLWLASLGGLILIPLGLAIAALGAAWAVTARRRMRFHTDIGAPGVVEVTEGQVSYMGPTVGGMVALEQLADLRLITLRGRKLWRLRQTDGQTILIPVDAAGADRLYDAFVSLPGMDTAALVAALKPAPASGPGLTVEPAPVLVWRRASALRDQRA